MRSASRFALSAGVVGHGWRWSLRLQERGGDVSRAQQAADMTLLAGAAKVWRATCALDGLGACGRGVLLGGSWQAVKLHHPGLGPALVRARLARRASGGGHAQQHSCRLHVRHGPRPLDIPPRDRPLSLPNMDTAVGLTSADQVLDLANIRSTLMCVKSPAI